MLNVGINLVLFSEIRVELGSRIIIWFLMLQGSIQPTYLKNLTGRYCRANFKMFDIFCIYIDS